MNRICSVAIDGPAGAGKSTIARAAAKRFGFIYVDTGAIYRTVGLAAKRSGTDPHDADAVKALLPSLLIRFEYDESGIQRMFLGEEDVSGMIRTPDISLFASAVSAIPAVRAFLLDMQRNMAKTDSVVMDGRDIGTVVLPDAGCKIFLTASAEARARRRFLELCEKGDNVSFSDVLADMVKRDNDDTTRTAAPLRAAGDAVVVDTTDLTLEDSIDRVCDIIRERFAL